MLRGFNTTEALFEKSALEKSELEYIKDVWKLTYIINSSI